MIGKTEFTINKLLGLGRGKPAPSPGRIVATYSIFNTVDLLYDSLTSVARYVDEIRLYDGRFLDYACPCAKDHDNSCDDTMKEVEQWMREYPGAPPVIIRQWPAMPEMEKRSKMMQDVPEGDVVLVIDDDELLIGRSEPIREFANTKPDWFAYVDFLFAGAGHGTGAPIPLARLYVRTPGLRYESYYRLLDDKGLFVDMKADNKNVPYGRRMPNRTYLHPSVRIVELWEGYRNRERDKARKAYNELIAKRGWK